MGHERCLDSWAFEWKVKSKESWAFEWKVKSPDWIALNESVHNSDCKERPHLMIILKAATKSIIKKSIDESPTKRTKSKNHPK